MEIVLIAGVAEGNVIGVKNDLPWNLPQDLKRFKDLTTGHPVIVGKNTFDSIKMRIGKPLPNRINIVISQDYFEPQNGEFVFTKLDEGVNKAKEFGKDIFVIGGASIYKQMMPLADRLEITHVHKKYEGDAFFPEIDGDIWEEAAREDKSEGELRYSFVTYKRKKNAI